MRARKKILFVQPSLNPPGGGGVVAIWLLNAISSKYDVTIYNWRKPDLDYVNRYYGTSFKASDLEIKEVPAIFRLLIDAIPNDPWHFYRWAYLLRWCKISQHRYDLVISANNESDFGVRGIQYIHYPYFHGSWKREQRLARQTYWYSPLVKFLDRRIRPWRLLSGFSYQEMRKNFTIINSKWTGERYKEIYDADSHVVYPPAPGAFPEVSWDKRERGFVCISRISSEKRLIEMMNIIAVLREDFPELHLHIIGSKVEYDDSYYDEVKKYSEQYSDWVFWEEDVSREKLEKIVTQHRYGIHGMNDEHFGIAVAELLRAGCITFAPNNGGPIEILGNDARLLYNSDSEAIENIRYVLEHEDEQLRLCKHLEARKELYSTKAFTNHIEEIVENFLKKQ